MDLVLAAPNTDGPCLPDWTENLFREGYMGLHWESATPRGVSEMAFSSAGGTEDSPSFIGTGSLRRSCWNSSRGVRPR